MSAVTAVSIILQQRTLAVLHHGHLWVQHSGGRRRGDCAEILSRSRPHQARRSVSAVRPCNSSQKEMIHHWIRLVLRWLKEETSAVCPRTSSSMEHICHCRRSNVNEAFRIGITVKLKIWNWKELKRMKNWKAKQILCCQRNYCFFLGKIYSILFVPVVELSFQILYPPWKFTESRPIVRNMLFKSIQNMSQAMRLYSQVRTAGYSCAGYVQVAAGMLFILCL